MKKGTVLFYLLMAFSILKTQAHYITLNQYCLSWHHQTVTLLGEARSNYGKRYLYANCTNSPTLHQYHCCYDAYKHHGKKIIQRFYWTDNEIPCKQKALCTYKTELE